MRENAQIMHINDITFLLTIPKQDRELRTVFARQGPSPGQVFSYSNRINNLIPDLAIPGSFMEFPGSLHPLIIASLYWFKSCDMFCCQ